MLNNSSTRLNKYISESGICSRREADRFIEQGNVFINGKRAAIGAQVFAGDTVKVNGQLSEAQAPELASQRYSSRSRVAACCAARATQLLLVTV